MLGRVGRVRLRMGAGLIGLPAAPTVLSAIAGATGATYTTGAMLPAANALVIYVAGARRGNATPSDVMSLANTLGISFALVDEFTAGTASPTLRQAVWAGLAPASPVSGTITPTSVNANYIGGYALQIVDGLNSITNDNHSSGNTGLTVTLGSGPKKNALGLTFATIANPTAPTTVPLKPLASAAMGSNLWFYCGYQRGRAPISAVYAGAVSRIVGAYAEVRKR